jgi:hypothetical protein
MLQCSRQMTSYTACPLDQRNLVSTSEDEVQPLKYRVVDFMSTELASHLDGGKLTGQPKV